METRIAAISVLVEGSESVETINAVMMEAHYTSQQEVYDSNLPFILGILNTMTKEAQQIEAMNARIKSKH